MTVLRRFLALAGAMLLTLTIAACVPAGVSGSGSGSEKRVFAEPEAGAYPVTLTHVYGETTIKTQPQRLVVIGWAGADLAIHLGTVPVAQGTAASVDTPLYPWVEEAVDALGAQKPETHPSLERGEVDIEYVLAQQPDLIVAMNSGITEAEYDRLSEIAPTVAFPGDPWAISIEDHLKMMGKALGRPEEAEKIREDLDARVAKVAANHPEFVGRSYMYAFTPSDDGQIVVFGPVDPRSQLLEDLGLKRLDGVAALSAAAGDPTSFTVGMEDLLPLKPDVYVAVSDLPAWRESVAAHAAFASWAPVAEGRTAIIEDRAVGLALSTSTPLALNWGIEDIADVIAKTIAEHPAR